MKQGIDCIVVNPADIPTKDKEKRQKEDRRDSRKIARCLSNGDLDAIHVPSIKTTEDRFLLRTRQKLVADLRRYKSRVKSALYFQGINYPPQFQNNNTHWSNRFINWLEQIEQTQESGKKAFEVMLSEITHLRASLLLVNRKIRELSRSEDYQQSANLLMGDTRYRFDNSNDIIDRIRRYPPFFKHRSVMFICGAGSWYE